jgi:hypothetical protein
MASIKTQMSAENQSFSTDICQLFLVKIDYQITTRKLSGRHMGSPSFTLKAA